MDIKITFLNGYLEKDIYMDMLKENVEEAFLIGDGGHGDDPSTFGEAMSDIDFKK